MEQSQFVHDHDLGSPHDTSAAFACGDHFKTASRFRCSGEGWPLRLVGFADNLVLAHSSPGEDAGRQGTFQLVIRFVDQHRPACGHMAQGSCNQRGGFSRLHRSANGDLLKRRIVHRVQHFGPRGRGDAERPPGAGSVRDHDVAERPAPECAYTARGHRRGTTRQASFARLAIAAVASS